MGGNGPDYSKMPDNALMEALQTGDPNALTTLYNRYFNRLKKHLFQFREDLKNQIVTSEEIIQNTFLNVYKNADTYDCNGNFLAWLFKIAENKTISEYRTVKKERNTGHVYLDHIFGDELDDNTGHKFIQGGDLEEELELKEKCGVVLDTIEVLSEHHPEFMEAVRLKAIEGLTYEEISQTLGIPMGTVKHRLHIGRKHIKKEVERIYSIQ